MTFTIINNKIHTTLTEEDVRTIIDRTFFNSLVPHPDVEITCSSATIIFPYNPNAKRNDEVSQNNGLLVTIHGESGIGKHWSAKEYQNEN